MKKLIAIFALTASVWSSFLYSQNTEYIYSDIRYGQTSYRSSYTVSPSKIVVPASESDPYLYISETLSITRNADGAEMCLSTVSGIPVVYGPECTGGYLNIIFASQPTDAEPTQTCKGFEGAIIDGPHNSDEPFCANIGSTGGSDPQPLLCQTTCLSGSVCIGTSSGWLHYVTAQSCSAETGPISPDPEPCTENCEPVDPPPAGGGDGSDVPSTGGGANTTTTTVTGTQTDSQGNVTNISMTMDQDFTPVTSRQDETNQRLQVENQNSSTIINRLDQLITSAGSGTATDITPITNKLVDIDGKLGQITDGLGIAQDGTSAADSVQLPDYDAAIQNGYDQIDTLLNNGPIKEHTDRIEGIATELTAFDTIPQLFAFAQDNCTSIPFGSHSLDTCQYAPTISNVLTWASYMLVIIFLFTSIAATLTKIRLT
uniref:hypothetical protein n=1 Tax=Rheinheimera sp. TaxID=1869214 RepID=UPI00404775EB